MENKLSFIYSDGNCYELIQGVYGGNILLLYMNGELIGETSFNEIRKYIEGRGNDTTRN